MGKHFVPGQMHPIDLIGAEVSTLYRRTMKRAESQDRFLTTAEEFNLSAMSSAVSLRRIADALRILVIVLMVGIIVLAIMRV